MLKRSSTAKKVVKVFGYENKAKEEMQRRNKAWEEAAYLSNGHAMAMMPIMNGFGYLQYIVVALVGAAMAIGGITNLSLSGFGPMTVGMIASFLTLARNFTMPVTQISSQLNAIITALAGAARILRLWMNLRDRRRQRRPCQCHRKCGRFLHRERSPPASGPGGAKWQAPVSSPARRCSSRARQFFWLHTSQADPPRHHPLRQAWTEKVAFVGATGQEKPPSPI